MCSIPAPGLASKPRGAVRQEVLQTDPRKQLLRAPRLPGRDGGEQLRSVHRSRKYILHDRQICSGNQSCGDRCEYLFVKTY